MSDDGKKQNPNSGESEATEIHKERVWLFKDIQDAKLAQPKLAQGEHTPYEVLVLLSCRCCYF